MSEDEVVYGSGANKTKDNSSGGLKMSFYLVFGSLILGFAFAAGFYFYTGHSEQISEIDQYAYEHISEMLDNQPKLESTVSEASSDGVIVGNEYDLIKEEYNRLLAENRKQGVLDRVK